MRFDLPKPKEDDDYDEYEDKDDGMYRQHFDDKEKDTKGFNMTDNKSKEQTDDNLNFTFSSGVDGPKNNNEQIDNRLSTVKSGVQYANVDD